MQFERVHSGRCASAAILIFLAAFCLTTDLTANGTEVAPSAKAPTADGLHPPITPDQTATNRAEQAAAAEALRKRCLQVKSTFDTSSRDLKECSDSFLARFTSKCSDLRIKNMQDYMAWSANKKRCGAGGPESVGH